MAGSTWGDYQGTVLIDPDTKKPYRASGEGGTGGGTVGGATEAKQDTQITELNDVNTELANVVSELQGLLSELQNKADLVDTQPVAVVSGGALPWSTSISTPANLEAPGITATLDLSASTGPVYWTITGLVSAINTNIFVRALNERGDPLTSSSVITANGRFTIEGPPKPLEGLALQFVSESGGTAAILSDLELKGTYQ